MEIKNNNFFDAVTVANLLGISKSSAYRIIKKLNHELESMGKITIAGKVSRRFFEEKIHI